MNCKNPKIMGLNLKFHCTPGSQEKKIQKDYDFFKLKMFTSEERIQLEQTLHENIAHQSLTKISN